MSCIRPVPWTTLLCSLSLVACGSSGGERGTDTDPNTAGETPTNAYDAAYAKCGIHSDFKGDELCIVAPDPSEGFQLHYGPDDYSDPEQVAKFTLDVGGEIDDQVQVVSGNDQDILFSEYHSRLRPGTHHMILWAADGAAVAQPGLSRFLLGQQSALGPEGGRLDIPIPDGKIAPENAGAAEKLGAHSGIAFNMHYVNQTDGPILREGWVNFHYTNPDDVTQIMDPVTFYGGLGMNVQPHSHEVVKASCQYGGTGEPLRIMGLTGHMHSHGQRFTAYKVSKDASGTENKELVYETYNWSEADNLQYDSLHENVLPNATARMGGGTSGQLLVNPGDRIDYECEYQNDDDFALHFANEAYKAEMCNLFGFYVPSIGRPWACWNQ